MSGLGSWRSWSSIVKTFRTARYLRWRQLVYRPLRLLQERLPVSVPLGHPGWHTSYIQSASAAISAWCPQEADELVRRADEIVSGVVTHAHHRAPFANLDWTGRHVSHYWTYQHQSFGFVVDLAWAYRLTRNSVYLDRVQTLVRSWIHETHRRRGDAWAPHPMSARVANWTFALLILWDDLPPAFREEIGHSIYGQLHLLNRRLEFHLLANHLQKNCYGLTIGSILFDGKRAEGWFLKGLRGMHRALESDFLEDGGHCERSPMYHAIAFGDFLEVASVADAVGVPFTSTMLLKMEKISHALAVMSRPDGSLHLFNDAANGTAPPSSRLSEMARLVIGQGIPKTVGTVALPDTGYYAFVSQDGNERMIVDGGPPGPSYQLGHAHCDFLSFELDLAGVPVVVDSGVGGYDGDPLREYVRSVRAHNTVEINGQDQHEMWATFRVARRGRLSDAYLVRDGHRFHFVGSYAPFHDRCAVHHREIVGNEGEWTVLDRVQGALGKPIRSFLHFHPSFAIEVDGEIAEARSDRLTVRIHVFGVDEIQVKRGETVPKQGWYCPAFGRAIPAPVLQFGIRANTGNFSGFRITWESNA